MAKGTKIYSAGPWMMLFLLFLAGAARAEGDIKWVKLETKHTIINYQNQEDLIKFDKKIKYSSGSGFSLLPFSQSPDPSNERLKNKVDSIYKRVQEILDMRKPMESIRINIYSSKNQLHEAYYGIYKKQRKLRAWYIYEYNSIYLTVEDVCEGMLAHEMAHSIIDHYLTVRPPPATAEILARYVDSHLLP